MLVLVFDTKERIDKSLAWLGPNNKYYTSEEAYRKLKKKKIDAKYYKNKKRRLKMEKKQNEEEQKAQQRKEKKLQKKQRAAKKKLTETEHLYYEKCVDRMFNWMDKPTNGYMIPIFFKRLKDWHEKSPAISYEIILETMDVKDEDVRRAIETKTFKDETAKVLYICAIVSNGFPDGMQSFEDRQKAIQAAREEAEHIPYDIPTEEELMNLGNREEQSKKDHTEMREIMKRIMGGLW